MTTAVVLSGRLTDDGHLELDEPIPLEAGPVRVTLEPVSSHTSSIWPSEAELKSRKESLLKLAGTISDEDAAEMLAAIHDRDPDPISRRARLEALAGSVPDEDSREILQIVEANFEQVDPDEWR